MITIHIESGDNMVVNALIIAMIVLFIHSTTWEGMIFEGIKKLIKPEGKLYKPIYGCPICMTPWWGTLIYLILLSQHPTLREWFLTIGLACGFSVITVAFLSMRDMAVDISNEIEKDNQEQQITFKPNPDNGDIDLLGMHDK